jgi:alginate O-acetyltransferase complex protein AlgI
MGISFFVFQNLGYTVDVYRGLAPERHVGRCLLFISFFPQLVAGPIERAKNLLPGLRKAVHFDPAGAISGLRLMLWGMFKKVILADRLSVIVDSVYDNPVGHASWTLLIATYFFAFQIFCDFSGYTDIAIGAGRVLGIDLMENFRRPCFADSVTDFWRRWHISLSTWFKDYLYVPLGGNRTSQSRWCFNIFIVFVVSGLWHGAAWTFAIWGALHGAYLVIERTAPGRVPTPIRAWWAKRPQALRRVLASVVTFHLVLFAWVFFRARSLSDVGTILHAVGTLAPPDVSANAIAPALVIQGIVAILLLEVVHAFQALPNARLASERAPVALRWSAYLAMLLAVLNLRPEYGAPFIYFRF